MNYQDFKQRNTRENPSRHLVKSQHYYEFLSIITGSICFQISCPGVDTARSYKIHVEDVVSAFEGDRKYGVMDVKEEFKKKPCWQVYIDEKENRLCILWQVFFVVEDEE